MYCDYINNYYNGALFIRKIDKILIFLQKEIKRIQKLKLKYTSFAPT
jgi:hypothetical protein